MVKPTGSSKLLLPVRCTFPTTSLPVRPGNRKRIRIRDAAGRFKVLPQEKLEQVVAESCWGNQEDGWKLGEKLKGWRTETAAIMKKNQKLFLIKHPEIKIWIWSEGEKIRQNKNCSWINSKPDQETQMSWAFKVKAQSQTNQINDLTSVFIVLLFKLNNKVSYQHGSFTIFP